ncbi:MAG: lamin tail domain-containing protein [bacterium]
MAVNASLPGQYDGSFQRRHRRFPDSDQRSGSGAGAADHQRRRRRSDDTLMTLFRVNQLTGALEQLEVDDDDGFGTCSLIQRVLDPGVYAAIVNGFGGRAIPDYTFEVECLDCVAPVAAELVINEIDYDQSGADTTEFVEIYNPGDVAQPLAGVQIVMVNGSNGQPYGTYNLSDAAAELPGHSYLVLGNAAVEATLPANTLFLPLPLNGMQNGAPDGLVLVRDLAVIDGLSYEGAMPGVTEGNAFPGVDIGPQGISRCDNGVDTDDNAADFALVEDLTPGADNICPPPPVEVAIENFDMNPADITIAPGTTVRWTNLDGAIHTVTTVPPAPPMACSTAAT